MTQISSAKKLDELFDVSKLSESSLRKYQVNSLPMQSYFKLTEGNLQEEVREHFRNELKVDPNDIIEKFLELKREEKADKELVKEFRKARGNRPVRAPL